MTRTLIVAAAKTVDAVGCQQQCRMLEDRIRSLGLRIRELVIEPLSADWHSPEPEDHFRSGCAPIEALARARELVIGGERAVLIRGEDHIKSGYERDERLRLMSVYGPDYPLTKAYTDLAGEFLRRHGVDADLFREISRALFENYKLSYRNALAGDFSPEALPDERWYRPLTPLFRGVDCANPLVDFEGRLLIVDERLARELGVALETSVEIRAVGLGRLDADGPGHIEHIAGYGHLREAYRDCCEAADLDFAARFRAGEALLEAYTCYPVVPMAFLLASGLVDVLDDIPGFLEQHSITITGGMNLGRGAWNNPALNALISMHHRLLEGPERLGMVHGNGGLGYRQGVALLESAGFKAG
ncbi:hypothetical protein GCM10011348_39740 [Marinobacterium nitratireducens]|uniref:Acetyl-CoA acetyltransferase n=1 Tax=Marinobacterium nitratireducens TaxID=518897 RepID=A0A917ZMK6_9GAMM|nr:hypothetical protein [Marinobacterium nitratireducens]GGO87172.1 hypothetical protein GCM10011348_39740 [Marinobacterium nitratireducens]